jgi:ABC-type multidrug transport system fused ATPase/permease subunit
VLNIIPVAARWERSELPLLLEALASACGAAPHRGRDEPPAPPASAGEEREWIESACARLNLEAESLHVRLRDVEGALAEAAPALLALPAGGFVGLLGVRGKRACLVAPDLRTQMVSRVALRDALCGDAEAQFTRDVDRLVEDCGAALAHPERVRRSVLRARAGSVTVALGWQMRVSPGSSFLRQVIHARVGGGVCTIVWASTVEYAVSVGAWWLLGLSALSGRFETSWLTAWVLLMTCSLCCRAWKGRAAAAVAVALGGLVKQRLIAGAVRLDPDAIRRQGAGGMLARVIEAEALESLALGGGLAALVAPIELLFAGVLLWLGAAGAVHALLLVTWIGALVALAWRNQQFRGAWTEARFTMTEDLVERMSGHRTRLAQEHPRHWHAGEDQSLAAYVESSALLDRSAVQLNSLVPRLWLLTSLVALAPAFLKSSSPASLALSIAAILLAHRSLRSLASGLADLGGAALAWRKIGPLFRAAADAAEPGVVVAPSRHHKGALLEAHNLVFRYRDRGEPLLQGCSLTIHPGDWVLLEGASGKGKSTLASLLTGLRTPESGLLLAGGLDYRTVGEHRWRRRVAYAPQSHENHIFSGSLAFNLLMGRAWPPRPEDMAEAQAVCIDLGLHEVIARMPSGLEQIVGESGWQLSEGERSRIFLGRALLSGVDLLVLDECFSALDPESLDRAFRALRRRAATVVMVAHR